MTGSVPPLVVVVDDNSHDFLLISEAWRESGHVARLEHYATATPFLARSEHLPRPDLIVLDLNLPTIGGKDLMIRAQAITHLRAIPIVICSSSSDPKDESEVIALGAVGYFQKPATFDAFLPFVGALRDLVDNHRL
ncbi:MAG: response regulator [Planctomycetes bacterium]|nr:response regulator [Planctomycetota bacterium]